MISTPSNPAFAERLLSGKSVAVQVFAVICGIAALTLAAKIKVPMWPVPVSMGTFAVLGIGATFGMRLGLASIAGYLVLGAIGLDVFSGSSETRGLAYMLGGTGGYLFGFVVAIAALGALFARGWDRSLVGIIGAFLIANALIYVFGLGWLGHLHGWDKPILQWGLWPFLPGDALKLALATMMMLGLRRFS